MNVGLTVLFAVLLVAMSAGAVVLVGAGPVAAQSNETGDTSDGSVNEPVASGSEGNDSTGASDESAGGAGSPPENSPESPNTDPESGAGANTSGNGADGSNDSGNSTGSPSDTGTYTTGEDDDDGGSGLFSVTIDPVGVLINFFEPFFTFGTDMLVGMAEALQSSTVYPMQDGSVAIGGEPDSELMSILHDYWYGVGLVAGAAIWLINTLVLYILGMVWPPTPTYQQIKVAQNEAWIKLLLIPFSWALGTIILFLASFVLNAIPLDPEVIAPDTSSIAANNAAAGISVLLLYAFGGPFALMIAVTFFMTWLFLYIIFPALPILIAMSVPKVWLMKGVAESFESVVETFPSAAFFPVPAVIVLSVGYTILGAIEEVLPGPAEWGAVPASAVAIVVIWILAFVASMYMFWSKRVGSGAGAVLAGSIGLGAVSSALGRLGGGSAAGAGAAAGGAAGSGASSAAGGVSNAVNGHALGSGSSGGSSGALGSDSSTSSLSAGSSGLDSAGASAPTTAGTSSGTALPSGSGSGSLSGPTGSVSGSDVSSGSTASVGGSQGSMPGRVPVDAPSIATAETTEDLPSDQRYRMGYFTGTGPGSDIEFQKILDNDRPTDVVTGEQYRRANEAYGDRELFVRGMEDQQFYDVRPAVEKNTGLGLSEAEQNAESRSTVDDARRL